MHNFIHRTLVFSAMLACASCTSTKPHDLSSTPLCHESIVSLLSKPGAVATSWKRDGSYPTYGTPTELRFEGMHDLSADYLSPVSKLDELTRISFVDSNFDDTMVSPVCDNKSIEVIQLDGCNISESGLRLLASNMNLWTISAQNLSIPSDAQSKLEDEFEDIEWIWK